MKIKSLSGPYFAGPVSGVCLLSLLAAAVICPNQSSAWVNATGGDAAQSAQLTSEGSGAWDTQNSASSGNNSSSGTRNNNNTGDLIANADGANGGTPSPLANDGIELFAATSSLTVGGGTSTVDNVTGNAEPGGTAYAKSNITYSASDIASWQLRVSYASGYSALAYEGTGGTAISGANGALTDNTWGYAWTNTTDAATPTSYSTMPAYGSPANMKTGTGDVNTTGTIHFAAKFASNATSGHYKTNVLVSLVSTPKSITYTLTLDANGGSNAPTVPSYSGPETSHTFTIPTSKPTKDKYDFLGWASSSTATTKEYDAGGTITLSSTSPTKTLYAVWKAQPQGLTSITNMQQMTSAICTASAIGDTKTLTDTRDNNTYTVTKLADGKCWMTQNLRLAGGSKLTSADSNVASDYTLPATNNGAFSSDNSTQQMRNSTDNDYGAYYSFNAATANSAASQSSGTAAYDICPKGWRLPTGNTSGEFYKLAQQYPAGSLTGSSNTTGWTTSGVNSKAGRWLGAANAASGGAFFPAAGYMDTRASVQAPGSYGYYWSSTLPNANAAYYLYFSSNAITPATNGLRYVGISVRCVAK